MGTHVLGRSNNEVGRTRGLTIVAALVALIAGALPISVFSAPPAHADHLSDFAVLADIDARLLTTIGDVVYFRGKDGDGSEPWVTDGTAGGTMQLADLAAGAGSSFPSSFVATTANIYFAASGSIYRTDGTTVGTVEVADNLFGGQLAAVNDTVYYTGTDDDGERLWKITDGGGPARVQPGPEPEEFKIGFALTPRELTPYGPFVIFNAETWTEDGDDADTDPDFHGEELWISDGTDLGTFLVKVIRPGGLGSYPWRFTEVGDYAYFSATSAEYGIELWRTDGTEGGTVLVDDIVAGTDSGGAIDLVAWGDSLLFGAGFDGPTGVEPHITDSAGLGSTLLGDIYPGAIGSGQFGAWFTPLDADTAVFAADDGDSAHGNELWVTDGTPGGTMLLADIVPGTASSYPAGGPNPKEFGVIGGLAVFAAGDETAGEVELWGSDGTEEGTHQLADLQDPPSGIGAYPSDFSTLGTFLIFSAETDGDADRELVAGRMSGLIAVDDAAMTREDEQVVIDVLGNDSGLNRSVSLITQPDNGTTVNNAFSVTYTPDPGFTGVDTFFYEIMDGTGASDSATVTVTVTANEAPDAVDDAAGTTTNTPIEIDVISNDTDPEDDAIAVTDVGAPNDGTAELTGPGVITYTPDAAFEGVDEFVYELSDSYGDTDVATVVVTVSLPDPPEPTDDSATTKESTPVVIDVLDNDSGGGLTVTDVSDPPDGVASTGGVTITYTPDATFVGDDTFVYEVTDSIGRTDTATVTVTVTENQAPVVDAGPDGEAVVGEPRPFEFDFVDVDKGSHTATLDPGDGTGPIDAAVDEEGATATADHTYTSTGEFVAEACVEDELGASDCDTTTITVLDSPPELALSADFGGLEDGDQLALGDSFPLTVTVTNIGGSTYEGAIRVRLTKLDPVAGNQTFNWAAWDTLVFWVYSAPPAGWTCQEVDSLSLDGRDLLCTSSATSLNAGSQLDLAFTVSASIFVRGVRPEFVLDFLDGLSGSTALSELKTRVRARLFEDPQDEDNSNETSDRFVTLNANEGSLTFDGAVYLPLGSRRGATYILGETGWNIFVPASIDAGRIQAAVEPVTVQGSAVKVVAPTAVGGSFVHGDVYDITFTDQEGRPVTAAGTVCLHGLTPDGVPDGAASVVHWAKGSPPQVLPRSEMAIEGMTCGHTDSFSAFAAGFETAGRVSGDDRVATAAAISAATFDPGVPVAYVATADVFPDALVAGPVAGLNSSPILLVDGNGLSDVTRAELTRLKPQRIVVVGGTARIPSVVLGELAGHTAGSVTRVAGDDRFETAARLSATQFAPGVPVAYVATGGNFPDAIAAGAAAAATGGPVLLVTTDTVPVSTAAELDRLKPGRIVVVGGPVSVSEAAADQLTSHTTGSVTRLFGSDRYATGAAVSASFAAPGGSVFIATGEKFPDSLTGTPAAAMVGAPVVLVSPGQLSAPVAAELSRLDPVRFVILGGPASVTDATVGELQTYL